MKNILFYSLGASWAVIQKAYSFLAPERLPLFQNHPQLVKLQTLRADYQLQPPDEIRVCTTQGEQSQKVWCNCNNVFYTVRKHRY